MALPEAMELLAGAKREIREIDAAELRRMQKDGERFCLIDVREPEETAKGTIAGAATIPRGVLEFSVDKVTTDKESHIICYCASGGRSALAAQSLKKMGFKNAASLAGGYKGWTQS